MTQNNEALEYLSNMGEKNALTEKRINDAIEQFNNSPVDWPISIKAHTTALYALRKAMQQPKPHFDLDESLKLYDDFVEYEHKKYGQYPTIIPSHFNRVLQYMHQNGHLNAIPEGWKLVPIEPTALEEEVEISRLRALSNSEGRE